MAIICFMSIFVMFANIFLVFFFVTFDSCLNSWIECRHHAIAPIGRCRRCSRHAKQKRRTEIQMNEIYRILIIFRSRRRRRRFSLFSLESRCKRKQTERPTANYIYKLADDGWSVINLNEIGWPNSSNRWQWFALCCCVFFSTSLHLFTTSSFLHSVISNRINKRNVFRCVTLFNFNRSVFFSRSVPL